MQCTALQKYVKQYTIFHSSKFGFKIINKFYPSIPIPSRSMISLNLHFFGFESMIIVLIAEELSWRSRRSLFMCEF